MDKDLESVKFNLTEEMSKELIKFNKLKKELNNTKDKNKIKDLEIKIKESRNNFIKQFQKSNEDEIKKYKQLKDQKWSFFCLLKGF